MVHRLVSYYNATSGAEENNPFPESCLTLSSVFGIGTIFPYTHTDKEQSHRHPHDHIKLDSHSSYSALPRLTNPDDFMLNFHLSNWFYTLP